MRFIIWLWVVAGCVAPALSQGTLYYTRADDQNGLFTLDTVTGQRTFIGLSFSGFGGNNGLAASEDPQILYGSRRNGLTLVNSDGSGVTTLSTLPIDGLAYDTSQRILYGCAGSSFFTVDPNTGEKLADLPSPGIGVGGLDYGNGKVYGLVDGGELLAFDPVSNSWSDIGWTGINFLNAGLAYNPFLNILYAKNGNPATPEDRNLYRIDPATASAAVIGDTGTRIGGGLAYVVPEPSSVILLIWGTVLLFPRMK